MISQVPKRFWGRGTSRGFSLIELLIVVAIILIIAAIAIPNFLRAKIAANESSAANSVFHAGSIRLRRRMAHGIAVSGTYTFSKSIDDASSIGGGGSVVAQNPFDIAADRGLSSFDQRHKLFFLSGTDGVVVVEGQRLGLGL